MRLFRRLQSAWTWHKTKLTKHIKTSIDGKKNIETTSMKGYIVSDTNMF